MSADDYYVPVELDALKHELQHWLLVHDLSLVVEEGDIILRQIVRADAPDNLPSEVVECG